MAEKEGEGLPLNWLAFIARASNSLQSGEHQIPREEIEALRSSIPREEEKLFRLFFVKAENAKTCKDVQQVIDTAVRIFQTKVEILLHRIRLFKIAVLEIIQADKRLTQGE